MFVTYSKLVAAICFSLFPVLAGGPRLGGSGGREGSQSVASANRVGD